MVKAGQTPGNNPLNKPFTPSALAHATTPATTGSDEDEFGEDHFGDDIELDMPASQNTPVKPLSRTTSGSGLKHKTPSASPQSSSSTAHNSPISSQAETNIGTDEGSTSQTPTIHRGKYPASRAIPKSALRSGAITPGTFRVPHTPAPTSTDPEILALEKAVKELESQMRVLRSQIDTLRQAEGLPEVGAADSGPVGRLGELMAKWRGVSQEAAEQVFEDVRLRFKDMGGLKGYKRQERERKRERVMEDWAWEKAGAFNTADGQGAKLGGVEEETFDRKAGNALALEIERQVVEEEDDEEKEFDMLAMLEMLHIEPEVIGWDVQKQAWIA